jgi:hypothetical protein
LNILNAFWFLILVISIILLIVFGIKRKKKTQKAKTPRFQVRNIPALEHFEVQQGMAIESGTRMHVAAGTADLTSQQAAASILGIEVMEALARNSAASDRPLLSTTSDGTVSIMLQGRLRHVYKDLNLPDLYRPQLAQMTGPTPYSYAAGTLPLLHDEHVSVNVIAGQLGPEVALIAEAGRRENAFLMGGSSEPSAQALLYAMADDPLIGEEVFAAPEYLQRGARESAASLKVQDLLRLGLVAFLIVGSLLKLVGVL